MYDACIYFIYCGKKKISVEFWGLVDDGKEKKEKRIEKIIVLSQALL